jgi:hypothetical protein
LPPPLLLLLLLLLLPRVGKRSSINKPVPVTKTLASAVKILIYSHHAHLRVGSCLNYVYACARVCVKVGLIVACECMCHVHA